MKNILIPTDFSTNAWNAIAYAVQFLKCQESTIYFLHTYIPNFYRMDYVLGGPSFSAIPDKGLDIAQAGLEKTVADVKRYYPNPIHRYEMVSAFNVLTDEINELVDSKRIDLIIMGTQGATGAKEIFLGSNTVFVIRKVKIPVLAIPERYSFRHVDNILFPTDYKSAYTEDDLSILLEMTMLHRAIITVVHIKEEEELTESQRNHKVQLDKSLETVAHSIKELAGTNMPGAITSYAEQTEADLICVMNRKHSFLQRLLIKQNVDQIGFHVKVPFLVIPEKSSKT